MNSKVLLYLLGLISVGLAANSLFTPVQADDYTVEDLLTLQDPAQPKVTICHIPPGQPDNRHEITVGESAVAAHIAEHGDYIGPCAPTPIW
jgi:hypothetical protein